MNKTLVFILLTFGLLATSASALNTPVIKKSLYIRDWGRTLYDIFRTKDATVSFSTDHTTYHEVDPTYRVLGFSPSNVTEVLRDLSQDCDQDSYVYSRLTYYEKNDSLLYFCYNNKSLLVLDSHRYTCVSSLECNAAKRLSFDFPHLEAAKLYPENDSLVILLVKTGDNSQDWFNHTVFIRVNLTSQQVTQNFVLDQGFGSLESVVAYAGNGTSSYILTNVFNVSEVIKTTTLYSFSTSGNSYSMNSLYTETFHFHGGHTEDIFSQLYVAGDLVITNNNDSLLFFNNQGQLSSKIENLAFETIDFAGWRRTPAFFEGRNKIFYYESNGTITQFTVQGTSVKAKFLVSGTQLQVARGNSQQGDQVFYLQEKATHDDSYWYVLDTDTSKIISQVPQVSNNIFTTDTTYGVLTNKTVSIFNFSNDAFLGKVKIETSSSDRFYFYDTENSYFYYLRSPVISSQCDLVQIDIRTGASRTVSTLSGATLCAGRISQVNSSSLDFVVESKAGYFVNSARFGQVNFTYTFDVLEQGFAAFNFDDLSFHLIHYAPFSLGWNHSLYTFDNRSRSFTVQNSTRIFGLTPDGVFVWNYFGGPKVFCVWAATLYVIDLSTNVIDASNYHKRNLVPTRLYGNSGDEGFILTDKDGVAMGEPYYYNQTTGHIGPLPTQQGKAIDARATGRCHYYQSNGYITSGPSENVIDIYDFCGGDSSEKVPFLKKFLRRYVL